MKKILKLQFLLVCGLMLFGSLSFGQIFQTGTNFIVPVNHLGIWTGSINFADVDGDGDQDYVATGTTVSTASAGTLGINDGTGNFTKTEPFTAVNLSTSAFADIDNDGDQDVLISGRSGNGLNSPNYMDVYINDGTGGFTNSGQSFVGLRECAVAFADVNGDNYQDFIISGNNYPSGAETRLYINDANNPGTFIQATGTSLPNVTNPGVNFADIDGDGDQDLLLAGAGAGLLTKLYLNDGNAGFTDSGESFTGILNVSNKIVDIDGDGDLDIIVAGRYVSASPYTTITELYINDGTAGFTNSGAVFEPLGQGNRISVGDVDGDGDQDILIPGITATKLYTNSGTGTFTEETGTPFLMMSGGVSALVDVDGDSDLDMILSGYLGATTEGRMYLNTTPVVPEVSLDASAVCAEASNWLIPIKIDQDATLGAISFVLDYDENNLTFNGFSSTNSDITTNGLINDDGDKLSFSWTISNSTGMSYTANTALLSLNFTPNTSGAATSPVFTWSSVSGDCELADEMGSILNTTFNDVTGTINATPTIGLTNNATANTICAGDNVTFTATGGVSYEFFVGATSVQAASATATYSSTTLANGDIVKVVGTDANGCSSEATITMVVNALPTPGLTSSDADDVICVGESVTYTASGADEYIFQIDGSTVQAQSATATYTTTGLTDGQVVSVIGVTTATGCQGTSTTTFTMSVINCYEYSGSIVYKNTAETYMGNVGLTLTETGGAFYTTTTSLVDGTFSFTNLPGGTYTLAYSTGKTHGGINSTDALRIVLHSVNVVPLTGLNEKAADVNNDAVETATDALLVRRRFIGLINSFAAGDWVFETVTGFTLSGDLTNQKIYALAYGDVNGSYTPNSTENDQPTVFFVNGDNIEISNGENVTIPIRIDKGTNIGAMSLAINYPTQGMTINNVTLANGQNVLFHTDNGQLRIAYADMNGFNLANNEVAFYIEATINDAATVVNTPMTLGNESEIANNMAAAYNLIDLKLPIFQTTTTNTNNAEAARLGLNAYPNPFQESAIISYNLATTSEVSIIVTNALGQQVQTLVNATQTAGEQQVNFTANDLPAGIYNYTIKVNDGDNQYQITRQLMLIK